MYTRTAHESGQAFGASPFVRSSNGILWGDTVNTASRMESHGVSGCVQITRRTYAALSEKAGFESRGIIEVKGKGPMEVFVARGLAARARLPPCHSSRAGAKARAEGE